MRALLSCFFIILREGNQKDVPLLLGEVLVVFVNRLTSDGCSQFNCNYLKNEKLFLNFLFHFWNLHQILDILKKTMIVIGHVFPKLQAMEILIRALSKQRHFRTSIDSQHMKASQILAKSPWEHLFHVFSSFSRKLIQKMSPLVLFEDLVLFLNRLTVDGMYPVQNCENL